MANDKKLFADFSRRDWLKRLAGLPVLGAVWAAGIDTTKKSKLEKDFLLEQLNIKASPPPASGPMSGEPILIGLIGFGIRGVQLMRVLDLLLKNGWMTCQKHKFRIPKTSDWRTSKPKKTSTSNSRQSVTFLITSRKGPKFIKY